MRAMKRPLLILGLAIAALGFWVSPALASPGLQTFADGGSTVTIDPDGSVSIVLTDGSQDGGVYLNAKNQGNKLLNDVVFSFVSTGDENGGAPRFSIPINTTGASSSVAGYAFIDAAGCNGFVPTSGATVTVSTSNPACGVNFQGVEYTNWATFAADFPTYRIAAGAIPFIIADGTAGTYQVNSIVLR